MPELTHAYRWGAERVAFRLFVRELKAGALWILLGALALSVMALSSVAFITERVGGALNQQANQLLAGDAVLRSESALDAGLIEQAQAAGLRSAQSASLLSMVRVLPTAGGEGAMRLSELRAVTADFPLRGELIVRAEDGVDRATQRGPAPGTAWLSVSGAANLDAKVGDQLKVGELQLRLSALIVQQPDASLDYFNAGPRLMLSLADLQKSGLLQEGARVSYRLIVAGDAAAVRAITARWRSDRSRGQRIETLRNAQPELRQGLERADRFLGLTALLCVVLAAVAIAMAAKRQAARQMDAAAVMRCLGAEQKTLQRIFLSQLVIAGVLGCGMGVLLAWALQWGVGLWLAHALQIALPAASLLPAASGLLAGMVVLLSFAMPPILQLRRVPALRVLRRDLGPPEMAASLLVVLGLAALAALMIWQAGSLLVGGLLFAGLSATCLVLAMFAALLMRLLTRLRHVLRGPLRYGLANAARRPLTTIAQVSALGMGLMVLLLLGFLQNDLIKQWRNELPPDFPNRFLINVQSDQAEAMQSFFGERKINTTLVPMIRGRLAAVNDQAITSDSYRERGQRAYRLAQREFNLSANDALSADNTIVEGTWWQANSAQAVISVEIEFAKRLGWALGDRIRFDIAGTPWEATITSLRKVKWESFSPNFFVIAPKASLLDYPASYIGSYRQGPLALGEKPLESELLASFPNVSILDLDTIIRQVQSITEQVARVVQAVFGFTLLAGILVLFAAVYASQDERLQEGAVMRALGAARAQLRLAQLSEFACLGAIACATALIAANVMMALLARWVFRFDYAPDFISQTLTTLCAWFLVCVAGVFATRRVVSVQPTQVLREL